MGAAVPLTFVMLGVEMADAEGAAGAAVGKTGVLMAGGALAAALGDAIEWWV